MADPLGARPSLSGTGDRVPTMAQTRRRSGNRNTSETHPANARPVAYGATGASVGFGLALFTHWLIDLIPWITIPVDEPVFAVFVTASLAGGAAGLTLLNLRYKRAESLRAQRIMYDERYQRAAELLGSASDLEVMAGAQLAGALVLDSAAHAQPAADLLTATLRRASVNLTSASQADNRRSERDVATANRLSNFITSTIAEVTRDPGSESPALAVAWRFDEIIFGDEVDFSGCHFGRATRFIACEFRGMPTFVRAHFRGDITFARVTAPVGLSMLGLQVDGLLEIVNSDFATPGEYFSVGIDLEGCVLESLYVYKTSSDGGLRVNGAQIDGAVVVTDSSFHHLQFLDSRCNHHLRILGASVTKDLSLRNTRARKHVTLADCNVGEELEIVNVISQGEINVAHCRFATSRFDHEVVVSDDPDWRV